MYSLTMPVGVLRTKMREEFERHRYVKHLPVVDTLLFQSHAEFQVGEPFPGPGRGVVVGERWNESRAN